MPKAERIYWLHALAPLHVGTGRGEGYIDLPLAREKSTKFPYVPGSSVKGVFADAWQATDARRQKEIQNSPNPEYQPLLHAAFGTAGGETSNAGALVFTDARLVCLPVRSLFGTFAWTTSRLVLQRLARDFEACGAGSIPGLPKLPDSTTSLVPDGVVSALLNGARIYLEDLDLPVRPSRETAQWARCIAGQLGFNGDWQSLFVERFVVLPDDVFTFLAETATEVQPHIRIDPDKKAAADAGLWYEESLPAEAILAGLVWCDEPRGVSGVERRQVVDLLRNRDVAESLQFGGKATVGKGRARLLFASGSSEKLQ